jgi:3-deoxy-D-manno-octulosonic-acid transferase
MRFLYSIVFEFINLLLPLGKYFKNKKIKAFVNGRLNDQAFNLDQNSQERYWFHCASLGEFEQAKPIIEKLKETEKNCQIIITFFSPSGFEYSKDYVQADAILYLPIDTAKNAKKLINKIKPKAVFFIKYELWYHHLDQLFKLQIPTYLVSAVFRKNQFLFSFFGKFIFNLLPRFNQIFLQEKNSYDFLKEKGLNNIQISGDTRFDRVKERTENNNTNNVIESFKNNQKLLILGSSWPEEESLLNHYLSQNPNFEFKVMIAPHDISSQHINEIKEKFYDYSPILFTDLQTKTSSSNLLILNTIGHLASAYFYADIAFIGGGFGKGLHNILEPLAFDVPVIFGPQTNKYPEAQSAIDAKVGFQITDFQSFEKRLNELLLHKEIGKQKDFIVSRAGASQRILKAIGVN